MRQAWRVARLRRLLVALAIMLVAVLPHATLAASMSHPAAAPAAQAAGAHHAGQTSPCHEDSRPDYPAQPAMPSCCIVGCGLLAAAQAPDGLATAVAWRSGPLALTEAGEDTPIEPAERPPRRRPARI